VGTNEGPGAAEGAQRLRDALARRGWREGDDLQYVEVSGGEHNEAAWANLVEPMLRYLFPRSRS
jgi:hypothetical protein